VLPYQLRRTLDDCMLINLNWNWEGQVRVRLRHRRSRTARQNLLRLRTWVRDAAIGGRPDQPGDGCSPETGRHGKRPWRLQRAQERNRSRGRALRARWRLGL